MTENLLQSPGFIDETILAFKKSKEKLMQVPFPFEEKGNISRFVLNQDNLGIRKIILETLDASWYKTYFLSVNVLGLNISGVTRAIFSPPPDFHGISYNKLETSRLYIAGLPKAHYPGNAVLEQVFYFSDQEGHVDDATFGISLNKDDYRNPNAVKQSLFFAGTPQFEYDKIKTTIDYEKSFKTIVNRLDQLAKMPPRIFGRASLDMMHCLI